jgi:TonB family protein
MVYRRVLRGKTVRVCAEKLNRTNLKVLPNMKLFLSVLGVYFLLKNSSCLAQNDVLTAANYYNSGVELLKKGEYLMADSLFTLSLNKYYAVDAFLNRAITRKKLGNEEGFCNDIYMATANGDSQARNVFLKKCTVNDTTYFDGKTRIIAQHKFDSNKDSIIIDSLGNKTWYDVVDTIPLLSHDDTLALYKTEILPMFPGKEAALLNFLTKNIKYPAKSRDKGIGGTVYVTFVVNKVGKVEDIKILRGVSEDIDTEAIRVIGMMPQWFPGMQKGKFVKVQYNLPIKFSP